MDKEWLRNFLHVFYRAFLIPVSIAEQGQRLYSCASIAFEPDLAQLVLQPYFTSPERIIYTSRNDLHYGLVKVPDPACRILVGPLNTIHGNSRQYAKVLNDLSLPLSKTRALDYWLSKTPTADHRKFIAILRFLDFSCNGSSSTPVEADPKEIAPQDYTPLQQEESVYHNTKELEDEVLSLIESGNSEQLLKILERIPEGDFSRGLLNMNEQQAFRCLFVTCVALSSRAAVRGGVDYDLALSMSDRYIHEMNFYPTAEKFTPLFGIMILDYCEKVQQLHRPQEVSSLTVEILRDIQAHLYTRLTVPEIAARLSRSPSYLSHSFSAEMGHTLHSFIEEQKIREAERLLISGTLSISEISEALCFSSQPHLQTVFKRITGRTPAQYRENPPQAADNETFLLGKPRR